MSKKAIILLSGGMDSATVLAMARDEGFECHCLSFRYGQRHEIELKAAGKIAASLSVRNHKVIDIDLGLFGGSAAGEEGEEREGEWDASHWTTVARSEGYHN